MHIYRLNPEMKQQNSHKDSNLSFASFFQIDRLRARPSFNQLGHLFPVSDIASDLRARLENFADWECLNREEIHCGKERITDNA